MIDTTNPEINFALQAIRQASLLIKRIQNELISPVLVKADRSSVTVADFASQAVVGGLISLNFPSDVLVAEENSHILRLPQNHTILDLVTRFVLKNFPNASPEKICNWIDRGNGVPQGRFWVLDPLDGTKGFLRGGQYAVALALLENDQVQISALGCPKMTDGFREDYKGPGSLVIAVRNQGTWTTPLEGAESFIQLSVAKCNRPSQARMLRSFEADHTNASQIDRLVKILEIQAAPVLMDSQAKYALLAAGGGELVLRMLSTENKDYREKIWDQAPGSLIVEEAGGCVTDLDGNPLDFSQGRALKRNRGILASNRFLHTLTLDALKEITSHA